MIVNLQWAIASLNSREIEESAKAWWEHRMVVESWRCSVVLAGSGGKPGGIWTVAGD